MEITTPAQALAALYRLTGTVSGDDGMEENGEDTDEVGYIYLTRGFRAAQRWLIARGLGDRWRKRSSALSWSGADSTDGGRYAALPDDFLRLTGVRASNGLRSGALREANGDAWGQEIAAEDDRYKGNFYYLKSDQLWLARDASPPTTLYLDYFYKHPAISAATVSFDVPVDAVHLCVAEGANAAKEESWMEGGAEAEAKIERALARAQGEAVEIARQSRNRGKLRHRPVYGSRW